MIFIPQMLGQLLVSVLCMACSFTVLAESTSSVKESAVAPPLQRDLITQDSLLQLLLGLGIVLAAIFFLAWLVRRTGAVTGNQGHLKVVAGLTLGQREKVLLVQVGKDKQLLLGVTPSNISCLQAYDEPVVTDLRPRSGEFSEKLRNILSTQAKGQD